MVHSTSQQLLPLATHTTELPEFIIGEGNTLAYRSLLEMPCSSPVIYLYGEAGCGKSLLASYWVNATQAVRLPLSFIEKDLFNITGGAYLLDPLQVTEAREPLLFHLLNLVRETDSQLLICARQSPAALNIRLPDLASRLRGAHSLSIAAPDDTMLQVMLLQQLSQRQLRIDGTVIDYLVRRMPRSYGAVYTMVATLDRLSLQSQRPITTVLAREALESL